ncbi:MAG: hypothetical protein GY851_01870, partial [bacterium]|nr:hypothetical protein [bacterium]
MTARFARLVVVLVGLVLFTMAASAAEEPQVVADSVAEFSGVQGQDGWYYMQLGIAAPPFEDFFGEIGTYDQGRWGSLDDAWQTASLYKGQVVSGIGVVYPVRRWVSEVDDFVFVSGVLDKQGSEATSAYVTVRFEVDGASVFEVSAGTDAQTAIPFSFVTSVSSGSNLDAVVTGDFARDIQADLSFTVSTGSFTFGEYALERGWPVLQQPWYFNDLRSLAINADDQVLAGGSRPRLFTEDGKYVRDWPGSTQKCAFDDEGYLYSMSWMMQPIKKHSPAGDLVAEGFENAFRLAGGNASDLFVLFLADLDDARVARLTSDLVEMTSWGSKGSGPGQFEFGDFMAGEPNYGGIALDGDDVVYVADPLNQRIQKFDIDGQFLGEWSCGTIPLGLAIDASGTVYTCDSLNPAVLKYANDGTLLDSWSLVNGWPEDRAIPVEIALDSHGNVYVGDNGKRVQKFSPNGDPLATWTCLGAGDHNVGWPGGLDMDGAELLAVDNGNGRINRFSADGILANTWGSLGTGSGQFDYPVDITVGPDGSVYVTDAGNDRVQKFDAAGQFLLEWGTTGSGPGQFDFPCGISASETGLVFVVDKKNGRIQAFTSDGIYVREWDESNTAVAPFNWLMCDDHPFVECGPDNLVYVTDLMDHAVRVFTEEGVPVRQFTGPSSFYPLGMTVQSTGHVIVSTYGGGGLVWRFAPEGYVQATFGGGGTGPGQFSAAFGLAADDTGALYVSDAYNCNIQKFRYVERSEN